MMSPVRGTQDRKQQINKRIKHTNKQKNKLIDTGNRPVVTRGEGEWGEGEMGKGVQLYVTNGN